MLTNNNETLGNTENGDSVLASQEEDLKDELKPHEQALVNIFGENIADNILHPKITAETSSAFVSMASTGIVNTEVTRRRPLKENEKAIKFALGRSEGAEALWQSLRDDAWREMKQKSRSKNEASLNAAYSAFARQCLASNYEPPQRSFVRDDSILKLGELLKTSHLDDIETKRRKQQLMFRMAQTNQDKYFILRQSDPLPDMLEMETDRTLISKYIPSWSNEIEDQQNKDESENTETPIYYGRRLSTREGLENLGLNFDLTLYKRKPEIPQHLNQRYHFMTQQENNPIGKFSHRFQAEEDPLDSMNRKQNVAQKMEKNRANTTNTQVVNSLHRLAEGNHSISAPINSRRKAYQPLSLGALVEYKPAKKFSVSFERDFRYGSMPMWKTS